MKFKTTNLNWILHQDTNPLNSKRKMDAKNLTQGNYLQGLRITEKFVFRKKIVNKSQQNSSHSKTEIHKTTQTKMLTF